MATMGQSGDFMRDDDWEPLPDYVFVLTWGDDEYPVTLYAQKLDTILRK